MHAGMSARTIARRVKAGEFVRVGPGLLCRTGNEEDPTVIDVAAHLQSGRPLTGPSAAAWYPPGPVTELVMRTEPWLIGVRHRGLAARYLPHPQPEVVKRKGLLVASPRQAALDCLRALPDQQMHDLAYRSAQQRLLTAADIDREVAHLRGARHVTRLRAAAELIRTNAHAHSENLFQRKLQKAGMQGWVANFWVRTQAGPVCIDIAFPRQLLGIEFDSPLTHGDPVTFRRDRRKWNGLKRLGWEVLNYTWDCITDNWRSTLAEIRFFHAQRSP